MRQEREREERVRQEREREERVRQEREREERVRQERVKEERERKERVRQEREREERVRQERVKEERERQERKKDVKRENNNNNKVCSRLQSEFMFHVLFLPQAGLLQVKKEKKAPLFQSATMEGLLFWEGQRSSTTQPTCKHMNTYTHTHKHACMHTQPRDEG